MSFKSNLIGAVRDLFKGDHRLRKELAALTLQVQAMQTALKLVTGSEHTEGLTLDPPLVMVQIYPGPENFFGGRRVRAMPWYDDLSETPQWQGKYELDEDDEKLYAIQMTPDSGQLFLGAYCLLRLAYIEPPTDDPPFDGRAVYHVVSGESQGFLASINGEPDVYQQYPWVQVNCHPENAKSDTAEDTDGEPYGKAWPLGWKGSDPVITNRIVYPVGTLVFLRYGLNQQSGKFWFSGFADAEHEACP